MINKPEDFSPDDRSCPLALMVVTTAAPERPKRITAREARFRTWAAALDKKVEEAAQREASKPRRVFYLPAPLPG
ncbi:MAG: hypothetical protein M3N08_03200 [Pseudomonadota bacterium]|nr:hypothetical protein [Pseudomonadota bacterium]